MVNVRKADGSLQPFDRNKVLRTCDRLKLSRNESNEVLAEVEQKLFEGIPTKKILDMIFEHGKKHKEHLGFMVDIREAISLMRPKPDFEKFVALILKHDGYKILTNKILQGKCIDHEIDVIAIKGNEILYIEVKHHDKYHTFTGLGTFLEINSTFEDLMQGFAANMQEYNITKPVLVVNTKISEHARKYSTCRGIGYMGWKSPDNSGIEKHIDDKLLYPLTVIRGVDKKTLDSLGGSGIFTLEQLIEESRGNFARIPGVDRQLLKDLVWKAEKILG
jgi:hypothetical protein